MLSLLTLLGRTWTAETGGTAGKLQRATIRDLAEPVPPMAEPVSATAHAVQPPAPWTAVMPDSTALAGCGQDTLRQVVPFQVRIVLPPTARGRVPVQELDDDAVGVAYLEGALSPLLGPQRHGDRDAFGPQPGQFAL
jgi:hypothetical protein